MINKLRENLKIKIVSLIAAIVIWLYVIVEVDPVEKIKFEDVPVTISNMSEINELGLIVYPENELKADVVLSGEMSKLKKITKENILIYGEVSSSGSSNKPVEGQNEIKLRINTPENINTSFKSSILIVKLEKKITESKPVKTIIEGADKSSVLTTKLEKEKVSITGPRSQVDKVEYLAAHFKIDNKKIDKFDQTIELIPTDANGESVSDVKLTQRYINLEANVEYKKRVKVIPNIVDGDEEADANNFDLNVGEIEIVGKKELIDSIEFVKTSKVNIADIGENGVEATIVLPQNITSETKKVTIKRKEVGILISKSFTYQASEVKFEGSYGDISADTATIADDVDFKVNIEYDSKIGNINKSDIILYINLSQNSSLSPNTALNQSSSKVELFRINTKTKFDVNSIKISPEYVSVK
ncbi:MAG: hypothetical protein LBR30_06990 [Clostridioides sp.]|jgi:YbbR domain-containing protein|nr:hypothetical protein [Clostridioides sp.]